MDRLRPPPSRGEPQGFQETPRLLTRRESGGSAGHRGHPPRSCLAPEEEAAARSAHRAPPLVNTDLAERWRQRLRSPFDDGATPEPRSPPVLCALHPSPRPASVEAQGL